VKPASRSALIFCVRLDVWAAGQPRGYLAGVTNWVAAANEEGRAGRR